MSTPFASIDNLAPMSNQTVSVPHTCHPWNVLSKIVSDSVDVLRNRDGTTGDLAKLINSIRRRKASGGSILRSAHVGETHHSSPLQTLEKKDVLEHLLDHRAVVRVSGLKLRLITIIMISDPFNHNITTSQERHSPLPPSLPRPIENVMSTPNICTARAKTRCFNPNNVIMTGPYGQSDTMNE